MTLYLEPPSGNISLQKLETFAVNRLLLLLKVHAAHGDSCRMQEIMCEEEVVAYSDCLIAGSMKDKISHFILRLLVGGDPEMSNFFTHAETALFDFHFSCMSENEMLQFFHRLDKHLEKQNLVDCTLKLPKSFSDTKVRNILAVFSSIKTSAGLSWRDIVKLYLAQSSAKTCGLPFQCVLSLLLKRHVCLKQGMAQVPLCKLREVVSEQFSSLMKIAASQARLQHLASISDRRMKILWRKLKLLYRNGAPWGISSGLISCHLFLEDVDKMTPNYPLCMSSLLSTLRQKHRLGHHARIQLTLFLKEIGLPVHHALALWQQEYSQPPGPDSRCSHSWQKDGRRYTYSIRHLYGLEGARRNYHGHCCQSLQQTSLGCSEEGGCPFTHWDDENLTTGLLSFGACTSKLEEILKLRKGGHFSAACQMTLRNCGLVQIGSFVDLNTKRGMSVSKEEKTESCEQHIKATYVNQYIKPFSLTSPAAALDGPGCRSNPFSPRGACGPLPTETSGAKAAKRGCETVTEQKIGSCSNLSTPSASSDPLRGRCAGAKQVKTETVLCEIRNTENRSGCVEVAEKSISDPLMCTPPSAQLGGGWCVDEKVSPVSSRDPCGLWPTGISGAKRVKNESSEERGRCQSETLTRALSLICASSSTCSHTEGTVKPESGCCGVSALETSFKTEQCVKTSGTHCSKASDEQTWTHISVLSSSTKTCENHCETGIQQAKKRRHSHCAGATHRPSVEAKRLQSLPSCGTETVRHSPKSNSSVLDTTDSAPTKSFCSSSDADQSCFDHEVCPSQMDKRNDRCKKLESAQPRVLKPVDYFCLSYKMMLDGLR